MEITVTPPEGPITLTLKLNPKEAMVLRTVCANTKGNVGQTPRSMMDSIAAALGRQGVPFAKSRFVEDPRRLPNTWDWVEVEE